MAKEKLDLLSGTLDMLVLRTLESMGPMHGYGIARRIEQVGADALILNQGTIYAALVRLQQGKLIDAEWGTSDNNRKAKYYEITARGRRRLAAETENWQRVSGVVHRILDAAGEASSP
jgi:transcriptional regulator